jgi:L-seryl-tRNA(Ser) seleniumtransferase
VAFAERKTTIHQEFAMSLNPLRNIPSVAELLESPPLKGLVNRLSHNTVVNAVRTALDEMRTEVQTAVGEKTLPNVQELADRIARRVMEAESLGLRPVINATGILLHTGLGRAPLADEAIAEITAVARDYASLEMDLPTGKRSRRSLAVEPLLKELTGAEAALVVNNNAGATMLVLAALGAGKEVIVSRGQLIEIGGSFRLPDVMALSGAILHEVGTTNKTHLSDYVSAISEKTAAILLVHPSNYLVQGFSETVELSPLVELGKKHHLPVIHDIGSGALIDFAEFGLPGEPMAKNSIADGADVVLFSGDKLIGGPQCGIILGRKAAIEKIQKHPFARALRVDKLTLAALAATFRLYRGDERAKQSVPLLRLLGTSAQNLKNRAERLAPQIAAVTKVVAAAEPVLDITYLGGGSIPTQQLPTWCIAISPAGTTVDRLAAALRAGSPSVVGRIQQDRLLLDLRSVFPRQDVDLVAAVEALEKE